MDLSEEAVAQAFVTARREGRALAAYPGTPPGDLAAAYRIQDQALRIDGRQVAGWKVGRINPPQDEALGANRLAGPIFADTVIDAADGTVPEMPVFAEGFAAAEAEFLLHLAAGWDGAVPDGDAATAALVDDVRIGIEVASSPYPGINADGAAVTVSDYGNNAGLVLGPPLDGWRGLDLAAIEVTTLIDGRPVASATTAAMLDGPYGAVRFLLRNLRNRGIDAGGGLWVSTGAVTGVHPVRPGETMTGSFAGHGDVQCRVIDADRAAGDAR